MTVSARMHASVLKAGPKGVTETELRGVAACAPATFTLALNATWGDNRWHREWDRGLEVWRYWKSRAVREQGR